MWRYSLAFVLCSLSRYYNEIGAFPLLHRSEFRYCHPEHRKRRMGTGVRIKFKPGNLRMQEIFWRGSEWVFGIGVAFEKFIRSTICRVPAALERNRNKRDYRGESVRAAIVELARPWTRVLARPNQNRGCNGV
jgi:hypothetical protein